jgi:hypothetical protein
VFSHLFKLTLYNMGSIRESSSSRMWKMPTTQSSPFGEFWS